MTPPLRELTWETSYGFDVIDFAEEIGYPLDEWEQEAVIRGGELLPDGRPRFRFLLIIVARQNGKTLLCRILTLYWMFIEKHPLVLGTSTSRETAKESWRQVIDMAEGIDILMEELPSQHTREQIGEETFWNEHGSHYRFAAPNRRAGRSKTVHRLILDELREHKNRDTYDAAVNAGNAVYDFQAWAITNQGDLNSIVLDELRESAMEFIETGNGDPRLGLLEWSAPNGCDPTDIQGLAMANPNLGHRIDADALMGQAIQAKRAGGETLARFRTEILCQRVSMLDAAIDEDSWKASALSDNELIDLTEHKRQLVMCYDVSMDGSHITLVAAARIDGLIYVEVVKVWNGFGATKQFRIDLPELVERVRPRTVGWFPNGPGAAVAADLKKRDGRRPWPPRRVEVAELNSAETPAVCMGLAEQVLADEIRHPNDEMLNAQIYQTQKLTRGDMWVFTRRGNSPIDGTYALAGAVHLARTLRPAPPPLHVVNTRTAEF